jgi:hypothetical protein
MLAIFSGHSQQMAINLFLGRASALGTPVSRAQLVLDIFSNAQIRRLVDLGVNLLVNRADIL